MMTFQKLEENFMVVKYKIYLDSINYLFIEKLYLTNITEDNQLKFYKRN